MRCLCPKAQSRPHKTDIMARLSLDAGFCPWNLMPFRLIHWMWRRGASQCKSFSICKVRSWVVDLLIANAGSTWHHGSTSSMWTMHCTWCIQFQINSVIQDPILSEAIYSQEHFWQPWWNYPFVALDIDTCQFVKYEHFGQRKHRSDFRFCGLGRCYCTAVWCCTLGLGSVLGRHFATGFVWLSTEHEHARHREVIRDTFRQAVGGTMTDQCENIEWARILDVGTPCFCRRRSQYYVLQ